MGAPAMPHVTALVRKIRGDEPSRSIALAAGLQPQWLRPLTGSGTPPATLVPEQAKTLSRILPCHPWYSTEAFLKDLGLPCAPPDLAAPPEHRCGDVLTDAEKALLASFRAMDDASKNAFQLMGKSLAGGK